MAIKGNNPEVVVSVRTDTKQFRAGMGEIEQDLARLHRLSAATVKSQMLGTHLPGATARAGVPIPGTPPSYMSTSARAASGFDPRLNIFSGLGMAGGALGGARDYINTLNQQNAVLRRSVTLRQTMAQAERELRYEELRRAGVTKDLITQIRRAEQAQDNYRAALQRATAASRAGYGTGGRPLVTSQQAQAGGASSLRNFLFGAAGGGVGGGGFFGGGGTGGTGGGAGGAAPTVNVLTSITSALRTLRSAFLSTLAVYYTFRAAIGTVRTWKNMLDGLIGIQQRLETVRLGIAQVSLVAVEFQDKFGKTLPFADQFAIGMARAEVVVSKLLEDSIKFGLNFKETVQIFPALIGPALRVKATLSETVELTRNLAIFGAKIGLQQGQLVRTIDNILKGYRVENTELGSALGLTNEMVKSWKQQGILVRELSRLLDGINQSLDKNLATYQGQINSIQALLQAIGQEATGVLFEAAKSLLTDIRDLLISIRNDPADMKGIADAVNLGFTSMLEGLQYLVNHASDIKNIFEEISKFAKAPAETSSDWANRALMHMMETGTGAVKSHFRGLLGGNIQFEDPNAPKSHLRRSGIPWAPGYPEIGSTGERLYRERHGRMHTTQRTFEAENTIVRDAQRQIAAAKTLQDATRERNFYLNQLSQSNLQPENRRRVSTAIQTAYAEWAAGKVKIPQEEEDKKTKDRIDRLARATERLDDEFLKLEKTFDDFIEKVVFDYTRSLLDAAQTINRGKQSLLGVYAQGAEKYGAPSERFRITDVRHQLEQEALGLTEQATQAELERNLYRLNQTQGLRGSAAAHLTSQQARLAAGKGPVERAQLAAEIAKTSREIVELDSKSVDYTSEVRKLEAERVQQGYEYLALLQKQGDELLEQRRVIFDLGQSISDSVQDLIFGSGSWEDVLQQFSRNVQQANVKPVLDTIFGELFGKVDLGIDLEAISKLFGGSGKSAPSGIFGGFNLGVNSFNDGVAMFNNAVATFSTYPVVQATQGADQVNVGQLYEQGLTYHDVQRTQRIVEGARGVYDTYGTASVATGGTGISASGARSGGAGGLLGSVIRSIGSGYDTYKRTGSFSQAFDTIGTVFSGGGGNTFGTSNGVLIPQGGSGSSGLKTTLDTVGAIKDIYNQAAGLSGGSLQTTDQILSSLGGQLGLTSSAVGAGGGSAAGLTTAGAQGLFSTSLGPSASGLTALGGTSGAAGFASTGAPIIADVYGTSFAGAGAASGGTFSAGTGAAGTGAAGAGAGIGAAGGAVAGILAAAATISLAGSAAAKTMAAARNNPALSSQQIGQASAGAFASSLSPVPGLNSLAKQGNAGAVAAGGISGAVAGGILGGLGATGIGLILGALIVAIILAVAQQKTTGSLIAQQLRLPLKEIGFTRDVRSARNQEFKVPVGETPTGLLGPREALPSRYFPLRQLGIGAGLAANANLYYGSRGDVQKAFPRGASNALLNTAAQLGLGVEDTNIAIQEFTRQTVGDYRKGGYKILARARPFSDKRSRITRDQEQQALGALIAAFANLPLIIDQATLALIAFGEDGTTSLKRLENGAQDAANVIAKGIPDAFAHALKEGDIIAAGEELAVTFGDTFINRLTQDFLQQGALGKTLTEAVVFANKAAEALAIGDTKTFEKFAEQSRAAFIAGRQTALTTLGAIIGPATGFLSSFGYFNQGGVVNPSGTGIPSFQTPTMTQVPGREGQPTLAVVHGGESIYNPRTHERLMINMERMSRAPTNVTVNVTLDGKEIAKHVLVQTDKVGTKLPNSGVGIL